MAYNGPSLFRRMLIIGGAEADLYYRMDDQDAYEDFVPRVMKLAIIYGAVWMFVFLVVGFSVVRLVQHDKLWGHCLAELGVGTFLLVLIPMTFWATVKEWSDRYHESS